MHPLILMTRIRRALSRRTGRDPCAWKAQRYERTLYRARSREMPHPRAHKVWSWISTGRTCDGCGEIVAAAEIQYDVEAEGVIVLRLHPECFRAWIDAWPGA
jgi:hypothetical protein